MKAITLKQPWAWAVCRLGKRVENRTWSPSPTQLERGRLLAIHGGKTPVGYKAVLEAARDLDRIAARGLCPASTFLPQTYLTGIVAVCRFGGTVTFSDDPWFAGPVGWVLDELVVLPEPVQCPGKQGLWEPSADLVARVVAQLPMEAVSR